MINILAAEQAIREAVERVQTEHEIALSVLTERRWRSASAR